MSTSTDRFQILSLDGGGLRGLFTASFLTQLESKKQLPVADLFDLIVGTSTGGIIALGLGLGFSAREILNLYIEHANDIFPTSWLGSTRQWVNTRYSADGLEATLRKYFGDKRLGDSRKRLVIPSYYPARGEVYIFKTPHHRRLENDYLEDVTTVARATAAAPTFLPELEKQSGIKLIDGGVWANNPALLGITEAVGFLDQPLSRIHLLRIGTTTTPISADDYPNSPGKLKAAAPLIGIMMRAQDQSASNMSAHLLPQGNYHEVNPIVAPGDFELDEASQHLVAFGESEYRKHSSHLAELGFFDHRALPFQPVYKLEERKDSK